MRREVVWAAWGGPGLEHLRVETDERGGRADGMVIEVADQRPFSLRYRVDWDATWRTRQVQASLLGSAEWELLLTADGAGGWFGADGAPLAALDGCLDVDLAATPFTNTLPIRRLALRPAAAADVRVAYLAVPELTVCANTQRYTRLADGPNGQRYRFEANEGTFVETLAIDADGLVLDYPGLFRRVWPVATDWPLPAVRSRG
jgi:hypothetical protein